jgi:hypothetical protein
MLLQIQAPSPFFIPPPQIGQILASLGSSLAGIIDPNRGRRKEIENFLLQNPEIGASLAAQQEQEEAQGRQAVAELTGVEGEVQTPEGLPVEAPTITGVEAAPANVLEAYGFNPEQARQALRPFRGMAQVASAQQQLQIAETTFNSRVFQRAAQQGTPEALADAQLAVANRDRWLAGLDERRARTVQPYIDKVLLDSMSSDPDVRAEAQRVQSILLDPNIEGLRLRAVDQLLEFQQLGLQDKIAQMQQGQNDLENTLRVLDVEVGITNELADLLGQMEDADKETRRALASQFNRLSLQRSALSPGSTIDQMIIESGFFRDKLTYEIIRPSLLSMEQSEVFAGAVREVAEQAFTGEVAGLTGEQALEDYMATPAGAWLKEQPDEVQQNFVQSAQNAIDEAATVRRRQETAITTPEQATAILAALPARERALVSGAVLIGKGFRSLVETLKNAGVAITEGVRTTAQLIDALSERQEE